MVAVADRLGLHAAQIAADLGLGHGDHGDQVAGDQARQPAGLLFIGSVIDQIGHGDVGVGGEADGRGVHPRQFLDQDGAVAEVAAGAAVFLGRGDAQQTLLASAQPQRFGHDAVAFPLSVVRDDLSLDEPPDLVAEHLMVVAENLAHRHRFLSCPCTRRGVSRSSPRPLRRGPRCGGPGPSPW